ncbi:hypothetical protein SGCOL_006270 [Colletotrichum sp. CLE4]
MSTSPTSTRIVITPDNTGLWGIKQSDEAAKRTSELLEKDLNLHHVFLNRSGFHDHMLHHMLALYGTGANEAQIQRAFDLRHDLQRPVQSRHDDVVSELLDDWSSAHKYLGKDEHYPDFLAYFQRRIEAESYEKVVCDTLLKRNAAANNMLLRLHGGVLHSLIQLMHGLEWKQPAIVAEGLAQTAVHGTSSLHDLMLSSEAAVEEHAQATRMPAILDLFEEVRTSTTLKGAARFQDDSKIRDGILQRAKEPMIEILRKVHVLDDELEERTAEMFHTIILVASSAAVHPTKHVKYDFFLM